MTNHQPDGLALPGGPRLSRDQLQSLPPETRDALMAYIEVWGDTETQVALGELLRELHGPLLFLLDYQARAEYRRGNFDQVLTLIERRQRRSTTIASQALEAQALLAAGYEAHAQDVADDISQAYPRDIAAVSAAALVYARLAGPTMRSICWTRIYSSGHAIVRR